MKKNIMFDIAASIETEKEFEELSMEELVSAMLKRIALAMEYKEIGSFGFCDEYEIDWE